MQRKHVVNGLCKGILVFFILHFIIGCNDGVEELNQKEKPADFTLVAPGNAELNVPVAATFSWKDTAGEDSYELQISKSISFTPLEYNVTDLDANQTIYSIPAGTLSESTRYYWRILATNTLGSTISTNAPFSFTTFVIPPETPPTAFNLVSPLDGSIDTPLKPTFTWENTSQEASYTLEVAVDANFTAPLVYSDNTLAIDQVSVTLPNSSLSPSSSYYWRILAVNSLGKTIAGNAPFLFTTGDIPGVFGLTSPLDGATDVSITASLQWDISASANAYILQVSDNSGFISPLVIDQTVSAQDQPVFSIPANTLAMGTTYYWRVIAANNIGQQISTASFTFTTGIFPRVTKFAIFTDENNNGQTDSGDKVVISFDQEVAVNGASPSAFSLPVSLDNFGSGASVVAGPTSDQVTIVLGILPRLKSRYQYDGLLTKPNSPSAIDISNLLAANAIEGITNGADAVPSRPVDIIPGFVETTLITNSNGAVISADMDSDGDLDLIYATGGGTSNKIWLNDGYGQFTDSQLSIGSTRSMAFSAGDLDGDGDMDIVLANNTGTANEVWLNGLRDTGLLGFTQLGPGFDTSTSLDVVLGDVDNDGDLDIIFANHGQPNTIWLNDLAVSGAFIDSTLRLGNANTTSIVIADLDGDNDLDLISGNDRLANAIDSTPNKVWINTLESGTFGFGNFGQNTEKGFTRSLDLGDLDGDGDEDLVIGNSGLIGPQANQVWMNNGDATFTKSQQLSAIYTTSVIKLLDYDGDKDLDILEGNSTGEPNLIWQNDGNGLFTLTNLSIGGEGCNGLATGDFDNDSDPDFVCTTSAATSQIWQGSFSGSSGSFDYNVSTQVVAQSSTWSLALVDVDNDADLDIVEGSTNAKSSLLHLNDGQGNFTTSDTVFGNSNTTSIAFGDLNGNGNTDLVFANQEQENSVWFNNYPSGFALTTQTFGGLDYSRAVAVGDLNNNGKLDIVFGNSLAQPNKIWLNDGLANFVDSQLSLDTVAVNTNALALADFDNDGDVDILAGNGQVNKIWLNQLVSNGINTGSLNYLDSLLVNIEAVSQNTYAIGVADVDGDGDIDFISGNYNQPNRVWLNRLKETGTLYFVDSGQLLGQHRTLSLDVGDVDGDGDIDFVVGNLTQTNEVWLNNGNGIFTEFGKTFGNTLNRAYGIRLGDVDGDVDLDLIIGDLNGPVTVYINE